MNFSELISGWNTVAVIGGGGKTGFIEAVERELKAAGRPALVTVTTRLGRGQLPDLERVEAASLAEALEAGREAARGRRLLLAGPFTPDNLALDKFAGLPQAWFKPLRRALPPDLTLLVEADGSAGLPLKCHRAGEPVMPPLAAFVVGVLGLSVLTRPWSETVHRPEILRHWLEPPSADHPLGPAQVSAFIRGTWTRLSPGLVFLNQEDALKTAADRERGRELADLLAAAGFRLAVGSLHRRTCRPVPSSTSV